MTPSVLIITPQPVVPMDHGAAIRVGNLAGRLGRELDLTIVVPTGAAATRRLAATWGSRLRVLSLEEERPRPPHRRVHALLRHLHAALRRRVTDARWRANPFGHRYHPLHRWYPLLDGAIRDHRPDVVVLEHVWNLATLGYLRRRWPQALYVLDAHNVESRNLERYLDQLPAEEEPRRHLLRVQLGRVRRLESSLGRYVDRVWACSETDLQCLVGLSRGVRGVEVPNGVDTHSVAYEPPPPSGAPELLYTGVLNYAPSEAAIYRFHRETWPRLTARIPGIRLTIVGRSAPAWIRRLAAEDSRISVASSVPDVRPYLRRAAVSICPLTVGSGTRLKILESMAAGRPVVSTTLGAEGIRAQRGAEILLADGAEDFAVAVEMLLRDRAAYESIRVRARTLVERAYDWEVIAQNASHWIRETTAAHQAAARGRSATPWPVPFPSPISPPDSRRGERRDA